VSTSPEIGAPGPDQLVQQPCSSLAYAIGAVGTPNPEDSANGACSAGVAGEGARAGGDAADAHAQRSGPSEEEAAPLFPRLLCVLVHRVIPDGKSLRLAETSLRGGSQNDDRLVFHSTYVGAALALHERMPELISAGDLATIAEQAVEEFDAVRWAHDGWGGRWMVAEEELRQDLELVASALQETGLECKVKLRTLLELREESGWQFGKRSLFAKVRGRVSHRMRKQTFASE